MSATGITGFLANLKLIVKFNFYGILSVNITAFIALIPITLSKSEFMWYVLDKNPVAYIENLQYNSRYVIQI